MQEKCFKERDCMSLDGFTACIRLDMQKRLGNSVKVEVKDVTKNNDTKLKALIIIEQDSNAHPSIYMESFYEQYQEGTSLEEIECRVLRIYQENRIGRNVDVTFFADWQKVKEMVTYKIVSFKKNRALLEDVPHQRILDLAVVYEIFLGVGNSGKGSILIRNSHMKLWGITEDVLHAAAFMNTPEIMGYRFANIQEIVSEILNGEEAKMSGIQDLPDISGHDDGQIPMFVLSNRNNFHGAGTILYKNLLNKIAEKWNCDICIIPSSIHEVILLPMCKAGSYAEMTRMVREVNQTQLIPEEILSDHVYLFVRETGRLVMQEEEEI